MVSLFKRQTTIARADNLGLFWREDGRGGENPVDGASDDSCALNLIPLLTCIGGVKAREDDRSKWASISSSWSKPRWKRLAAWPTMSSIKLKPFVGTSDSGRASTNDVSSSGEI